MHLKWQTNSSTSALHAAHGCWRFPERITDPEVLSTLGPYAERLGGWISEVLPSQTEMLWDCLIATGSEIDANGELASAVLRACGLLGAKGDQNQSDRLAGLITDVEAAFVGLFPQYLPQFPLRLRPLQDQWLGYGPGLMAQWKRLTRFQSLMDGCRIIGLQPVLGGYGKSHADHKLVRIEALLTNSRSELPEVVRLAWLVAQLHLDPLWLNDSSTFALSEVLVPLAMIPAALAAAQEIELTRCDHETVALAIEYWLLRVPRGAPGAPELSVKLLRWWQSRGKNEENWDDSLRNLANTLLG